MAIVNMTGQDAYNTKMKDTIKYLKFNPVIKFNDYLSNEIISVKT